MDRKNSARLEALSEAEEHHMHALLHWDKTYWYSHSILTTIYNNYVDVDPIPIVEEITFHAKPKAGASPPRPTPSRPPRPARTPRRWSWSWPRPPDGSPR